MWPLEWLLLRRLRASLIPSLRGRVLEVGAGTGVNLPFYAPGVRLIVSEPNPEMLRHVGCTRLSAGARCVAADATALPFGDGAFDGVAATLVLCSVRRPERALEEIHRVLRPGGVLALIEHVRGNAPLWRGATGLLAGPWFRVSGSCHLDRETMDLLPAAGLCIEEDRSVLGGVIRGVLARRT